MRGSDGREFLLRVQVVHSLPNGGEWEPAVPTSNDGEDLAVMTPEPLVIRAASTENEARLAGEPVLADSALT